MPKKKVVDNHRRCTQVQCSFYLQGGCKNCADCNAEPYVIKTDCQRCLSCEGVPDSLRWGDAHKRAEQRMQQKQAQEEMMIVANQIAGLLHMENQKGRIIMIPPKER